MQSARQIADSIEENFNKVCKLLSKLEIHNEVFSIELDRDQAAKLLNLDHPRRRMKFYHVNPVLVHPRSLKAIL